MVKTADDVVISATNFVSERLCPIFQVLWVSVLVSIIPVPVPIIFKSREMLIRIMLCSVFVLHYGLI
jgi:hypothetical protein